jgi:hypothetical protein
MNNETTYYTPITSIENGKLRTVPCKITHFINTLYKNNTLDKELFADYNSCQQYCIKKEKNEKS